MIAAAAFMITFDSSAAFVQLQCRPSLPAAEQPGSRPSWVKTSSDGSSHSSVANAWRRRRSSREMLRLGMIQSTDVAPGEPLAGASSHERPAPFVSRKLGSFEKMLTQTRDGIGPAEEGVRTLLTPHVWVSRACLLGTTIGFYLEHDCTQFMIELSLFCCWFNMQKGLTCKRVRNIW